MQDSDSTKWHTNTHGYSEVVYRDVWPSIDLRIYGKGLDLEQEFIVRPGGDLRQIQISYRGIDGLEIANDGSLTVRTAFGTLRETKPRIYQEIAGKQSTVDGKFKLLSGTSYSFDVGAHSKDFALVVDPTLLYSTFLGGTAGSNAYVSFGSQLATGVGVDSFGNAFVAGYTIATDFPTTTGSFQPSPLTGAFITKLNATGSALVYSTYLSPNTNINALAVDASGIAYVTGTTMSVYYGHRFPTTPSAFWPTDSQHSCAPRDFFMTALSSTGDKLVYSTCFNIASDTAGGIDYGYSPHAITLDSHRRALCRRRREWVHSDDLKRNSIVLPKHACVRFRDRV